jgi:hypothetical protein
LLVLPVILVHLICIHSSSNSNNSNSNNITQLIINTICITEETALVEVATCHRLRLQQQPLSFSALLNVINGRRNALDVAITASSRPSKAISAIVAGGIVPAPNAL